ncbi:MAG: DinB family protein [Haliscomenobacter sp.]|nr:DinB family protein [Haliscomenobacter sp.]
MDTSKWTIRIDANTTGFRKAFGGLNAEQLNWKPNPQTWSIAQNIDHLITINSTYFPVLEALQTGTYRVPVTGRLGFLVRFFGNFILQSVLPDRKRKMKTFPIWEPSVSTLPGGILQQFEQHQERLKEAIRHASGLLDQGAVISSPANKSIVYKLDKAFDIITLHEIRHLEQAREVLALMKR